LTIDYSSVTEARRASGQEGHHAGAHVLVSSEFTATPWHAVRWCRPCTFWTHPAYQWPPALPRTGWGRGTIQLRSICSVQHIVSCPWIWILLRINSANYKFGMRCCGQTSGP